MDDSQKLSSRLTGVHLPSRSLQTTIINLKLALIFRNLHVFQSIIDSALLNASSLIDGTFGVLKV
jgi:hypothetical protein